jgi:malate dehydrogenase (oxaloacetate-decarboxylating)
MWEDFATPNARPLLVRYQNELLTFNDDVQWTAAVVLGAVVGASKVARKGILRKKQVGDQTIAKNSLVDSKHQLS